MKLIPWMVWVAPRRLRSWWRDSTHRSLVGLGLLLAGVTLPLPILPPGMVPSAQNDPQWTWPFYWVALTGLLAGVAWLRRISWPAALLCGWAVLEVFWWAWQGRSLWCLVQMAGGLVVYVVASNLPARADRPLAGLVTLFAMLQVLHGTAEVLGWAPWLRVKDHVAGLPHGLLYHPNFFGLFLALCLPMALAYFLARGGRARAFGGPCVAWLVVLLGLSRARMAILALGPTLIWLMSEAWVALEAWGNYRDRMRRWVLYPACGLLLLGLIVGAYILKPALLTSFGGRSVAATVAAVDMAEWRVDGQWRGPGMVGWYGGLWTGAGLGMWRLWATWPQGRLRAIGVPELGIREQRAFSGWWEEAMNEPLQLLFELGWIGLALGLLIVWQVIRDVGWATGSRVKVINQVAEPSPLFSDVTHFARAWSCVAVIGLLTMAVAPLFHHVALAVPILLAAGRLRFYRRWGWAA